MIPDLDIYRSAQLLVQQHDKRHRAIEAMSELGQNRKSSVGLGMSGVGGGAEVDLITCAAGRVSPQEEPATLVR